MQFHWRSFQSFRSGYSFFHSIQAQTFAYTSYTAHKLNKHHRNSYVKSHIYHHHSGPVFFSFSVCMSVLFTFSLTLSLPLPLTLSLSSSSPQSCLNSVIMQPIKSCYFVESAEMKKCNEAQIWIYMVDQTKR